MAKKTVEYTPKKGKAPIGVIAGIILALILLALSLTTVPVGATGVVKTLGAIRGKTLSSGVHFKIPLIQTVVDVNNQIQKLEVPANAVSKDMQAVDATIAINYNVAPASSISIVRDIGVHVYENGILAPAVQECVKSITAKYTAEGLITERAKVGNEISAALEGKVSEYGILIQAFNIVNFEFSEEFNRAIEAKQVAQQNLIKTKTEQEQMVVKAEANAKAAEANARAKLTEATAEAEANLKIAASITPTLVEYLKMQKWNGALPTVSGGDAIVDLRP